MYELLFWIIKIVAGIDIIVGLIGGVIMIGDWNDFGFEVKSNQTIFFILCPSSLFFVVLYFIEYLFVSLVYFLDEVLS
jgi:hypothetical protein